MPELIPLFEADMDKLAKGIGCCRRKVWYSYSDLWHEWGFYPLWHSFFRLYDTGYSRRG